MSRIKLWTRMSSEELWDVWRSMFASDEEAIAEAIWRANRLVKDKAASTKRGFYDIKDHFIRLHMDAGSGQRVRLEGKECWGCGGAGCYRCSSTGLYHARWLYVHRFQVAGRNCCFHSCVAPINMEDGQGEDKEVYGGRFSEDEWKKMELPVSGLKKVLHHVATDIWGMAHFNGRYEMQEEPPGFGEYLNYLRDGGTELPDGYGGYDGYDSYSEEECPF